MSKEFAEDSGEKWVTINGSPVLIGDDGEIKGGAGGVLRGKPINPKSKSESRRHLNLLRERLTSGGLKRGERKSIERRIETLSHKILQSGEKEMSGIQGKKEFATAKDFVIFRSGHWNGEDFTDQDLDNMAKSYNQEEPPHIIIGHSSDYKGKTLIPSWGKIKGTLKRVGHELVAVGTDFNDMMAGWIRDGFFTDRSIELTKDNKRVLAVGMLGAMPPAVKKMPLMREVLSDAALQFSEFSDSKSVEFADAEPIDLEKVRGMGTVDTMKNVNESLAMCSKDVEMALQSDMDPEKCRDECMSAMAMCMQDVSDDINEHVSFTEKLNGMKGEDEEEDMEGMDKMMAKLREWLHIKPITQRKESDMDAVKEKEYQDKILALETQAKEFAEKERLANEAKATAEAENAKAAEKAKVEALVSDVKTFCETAVKENRMSPAMV